MLRNAKVSLELEDFDYLRECEKELRQLKMRISRAVKSVPTYREEDVKAMKLEIDIEMINDIIYDYHAWNKDKDEWINEQFTKDELNFEYKKINSENTDSR